MKKFSSIERRRFLQYSAAMSALLGYRCVVPSYVWAGSSEKLNLESVDSENNVNEFNLSIKKQKLKIGDKDANILSIDGTLPGTLVRMKEDQEYILHVSNHLEEDSSIHWHGLILPENMDGVPGVSYAGIRAGETFTYKFKTVQNGTYWYHSHSGVQEQLGIYGPLIIDPVEKEPFEYDREYVVMLTDWTFEDPHRVLAKLKKQSNYYNYQQPTLTSLGQEAEHSGWRKVLSNHLAWTRMRMDPTDFADVTGQTYTYLMNGLPPMVNWTALFKPGDKVRLRFINGSAMTYFDVRIPGLNMKVVQADGQNVQPVNVDEFRIAIAETYDVIVEPQQNQAFTIFAEAMDRSGFTRGTLAPRQDMSAAIPKRRPRPLRTMADMGMDMGNMESHEMDSGGEPMQAEVTSHKQDENSSLQKINVEMEMLPKSENKVYPHGPDRHEPGAAMLAMNTRSRLDEPGAGLGNDGRRVLLYSDLKSTEPGHDQRKPSQEIELHLTGNMERYMWSFDGKKYSEAKEPIHFNYGERLRLIFWNDTMMDHPIHLHGMWMELDNNTGHFKPRKHTINVQPAERVVVEVTADAPGKWAFHCHLLFHMDMGMFRVVSVS